MSIKPFSQFVAEVAKDYNTLKRKPMSQRTEKDQKFLNANKPKKPLTGNLHVHLKHEDNSISKWKLKLTKNPSEWESEAKKAAEGHLKHMQFIHDKYAAAGDSRPVEVHKTAIK